MTVPESSTVGKIALAAIKYSLLKTNLGKDVVFNFEDSLSFEGDSGPYLLYTIVRCKSILEKALSGHSDHDEGSSPRFPHDGRWMMDDGLQDELTLLRLLAGFPLIVQTAAKNLMPHMLCGYLHTLASEFSSYYGRTHILKSETEELKNIRLSLVQKIHDTLVEGVRILGFEEVEKM